MCGEQSIASRKSYATIGSPPRVRGTASIPDFRHTRDRITPACAGNRPLPRKPSKFGQDHPRVCGEQNPSYGRLNLRAGSPPRVRGTVAARIPCRQSRRITPACAGNSLTPVFAGETTTDHPRVCGEQMLPFLICKSIQGSPPRVRGTGGSQVYTHEQSGITPACAGNSAAIL